MINTVGSPAPPQGLFPKTNEGAGTKALPFQRTELPAQQAETIKISKEAFSRMLDQAAGPSGSPPSSPAEKAARLYTTVARLSMID